MLWNLASVCRQWRLVILDYPSFWAQDPFIFKDNPSRGQVETRRIRLQRSGAAHLCVSLLARESSMDSALSALLFQNMPRIQKMDIFFKRWPPSALRQPDLNLLRLRSITFSCSYGANLPNPRQSLRRVMRETVTNVLAHSVAIHQLTFHHIGTTYLGIDSPPSACHSLAEYRSTGTSVDTHFYVMDSAPNLKYCSIECIPTPSFTSVDFGISHDTLHTLSITPCLNYLTTQSRATNNAMVEFLQAITLPRLKDLIVRTISDICPSASSPCILVAVQAMLARSTKTLRMFSLVSDARCPALAHIIASQPLLEEVNLHINYVDDALVESLENSQALHSLGIFCTRGFRCDSDLARRVGAIVHHHSTRRVSITLDKSTSLAWQSSPLFSSEIPVTVHLFNTTYWAICDDYFSRSMVLEEQSISSSSITSWD